LLTAARESARPYDLALVAMLGLRIFEPTGAEIGIDLAAPAALRVAVPEPGNAPGSTADHLPGNRRLK
jgi:hypothetical protein